MGLKVKVLKTPFFFFFFMPVLGMKKIIFVPKQQRSK
jgi:hypothetical protein